MRSVLLLLSMAACAADAEPIEIAAYPKVTDPFTGISLERFRAGSPPSYMGTHAINLGAVSTKAPIWYEESKRFYVDINPSYSVMRWSGADPLTEVQPRFSRTDGLFIVRDEKGRVAQAWSDVLVYMIEYLPSGWRERYWEIEDTDYGGPIAGGRKPIEGRTPLVDFETRELKRDPTGTLIEILSISQDKDVPPQVTKTTYRNGPKRAMLITETNLGLEFDPSKLTYRQSYQRIYWPEGPGLIEIKNDQKKDESGQLVSVLDVEEHWKVSNDGVRKLDSRVDKMAGRR